MLTIVIAGAGVVGGVGVRPVPVKVTTLGLVVESLVTVTLAELDCTNVGENTTFQVHEAPAASVAPHVFVLMENCVAFVPVTEILAIVSVAAPVLVRLTEVGALVVFWSWLPNAILVGPTALPVGNPVPVNVLLPFTVPKIFSMPVSGPVIEGVNVRFTVQDALTAIVAPFAQLPVPGFAKLVALAPVIEKYGVERTSEAVPVFETTIKNGALVEPVF
jgi:hypothetical protein